MAINKILTFADTASGGNILTDTAYSTDSQRSIGHQPGIARQELANKQARQSSIISAGVAQFLADNQSIDVVDTLTPAQIATMLYGVSSKIFNSDDILTTGRALTANDINKHLVFGGSSYQPFTLPLANSVPSGSMIFVKGRKDFRATFSRQGSDTINIDSGSGFTSCSCIAPESIILVSNGNGVWRLTKINPFYNATAFTAPDRAANTNYTNSSPFPIRVIINVNMGGAGSSIVLSGASSHVKPFTILNSTFSIESWFYPWENYQLSTTGTVTIVSWFEYAVII